MTASHRKVLVEDSGQRCDLPPEYFDTVFVVLCPPAAWPRTFAIVTAHNPRGELSPAHANNARDRELAAFLAAEGIESFAVVGASPDLAHHEGGRAFAVTSVAEAAAVSSHFDQRAFFLVDGGVVFLCNDASGRGWKVGKWTERVVPRGQDAPFRNRMAQ